MYRSFEFTPHNLYLQVILAIAVAWAICAIITAAGGFPSDPKVPQYLARTDSRTAVLSEAKWFRFPYPGYSPSRRSLKEHSPFFASFVRYFNFSTLAL